MVGEGRPSTPFSPRQESLMPISRLKAFLARCQLSGAAKSYARRLPGQLLRDYGASEFYTAAQIQASVLRAKLSPRYIFIASAQYLTRETFDEQIETEWSYDYLRAIFKRFRAYSGVSPEVSPASQTDGISWLVNGDGSNGGHHGGF
jgi:hypothetical protein